MSDGPTGEMPFLEHLEELRYRLLWSIGALMVCMMIAFAIVLRPSLDIIGVLAAPVIRTPP